MITLIYEIRSECGEPSSRNLVAQNIKFRRDFGQLHNFIANISGTQQDIVTQKTAFQTTDTPAQANLIWCTLVHKRRKIGPEFWRTHRP